MKRYVSAAVADVRTLPLNLRIATSQSLRTPIDDLCLLARDRSVKVRRNVALNPHTPVDCLVYLAQDTNKSVLDALADNPNTPSDLLVDLYIKNPSHIITLDNPNFPESGYDTLLTHPNPEVCKNLVYNPYTPASILQRMFNDADMPMNIRIRAENRLEKKLYWRQ